MQATESPATARRRPRRPRRGCPDEFLGADADGREFWLEGGHVYCHPPSGPGSGGRAHVCRLAAFNRVRKR